MNLQVERREGVSICRIAGELEASNSKGLMTLLEQERASGVNRFVFSLSKLDYIDSSGLGVLVKSLKLARSRGGDVKLCGLKPEVRKVLELTRLDKIFDIHSEEEPAVEQSLAANR